jgi:hypothetical protein
MSKRYKSLFRNKNKTVHGGGLDSVVHINDNITGGGFSGKVPINPLAVNPKNEFPKTQIIAAKGPTIGKGLTGDLNNLSFLSKGHGKAHYTGKEVKPKKAKLII